MKTEKRFSGILFLTFVAGWSLAAQGQTRGSFAAPSASSLGSATSLPDSFAGEARVGGPAQNPFLGGIPTGIVKPDDVSLSLPEAVERGLQNNLGKIRSEQGTRQAEGQRWQALSALLPNLTTRTSEVTQQVNRQAFGFSGFPGVPNVAGPFGVFDTRAFLSQSVFNLSAIQSARAGAANLQAAHHSYQDAKEEVVFVVCTLYLQAVAGASRIEAARAQVNTAQALYDQAVSFQQAGVVPDIEVLRAQVELHAQQQQLILVQNEYEKQKLQLARAIGLPLAQSFRLGDSIPYTPLPAMTLEQALRRALESRADYQSALATVRAAEYRKKAAEGERYPSLSFTADYGDTGLNPASSHGTFSVGAGLRIPIFQGGRVRGEVLQADALLQQRKAELEDLRARIEQEVRTTLLDMNAAEERVQVARSALALAEQQLEQARDRFAAGVTSNLEVVQAQEALATARENDISGAFAHNLAKIHLARAMGTAEQSFRQFLLGETP
ncbi:MAG: TolC family protein [Acidobacteria bacterium]|nr:TolC family protein [Acidobacteriota bacterium]